MYKIYIGVIAISIIFLSSCGHESTKNAESSTNHKQQMEAKNEAHSTKGDIVSPDEVCMVNDTYMGKKQFEVKFNGNTYYGCCEMCKERIPKDATVRVAIDPFSKKKVDKSTATIAITGDNGEVSYFENEANYTSYLKSP